MANHLPLPEGRPLTSRRMRGNPVPERPINRGSHSASLRERLSDISDAVGDPQALESDAEQEEELDSRLVLKLRGSTRLASGPLNKMNLVQLGEGDGWTYAVMTTREARAFVLDLLLAYGETVPGDVWERPKAWAALFDNIEGIDLYGPQDRRDPGLSELTFDRLETVDVSIWPSIQRAESERRLAAVSDTISDMGERGLPVRVLAADARPQTTSLRIELNQEAMLELLNEPWIERIKPPLRPIVTSSEFNQSVPPDDLPGTLTTPIGVVDGLVSTVNPLVASRLAGQESFPPGHTFSGPDEHGTQVASIASWGSLTWIPRGEEAPDSFPLVNARVLDAYAPGKTEVPGQPHQTVSAAIRWLVAEHRVRVICLTFNRSYAVDSLLPSELTAEIDSLVRELDVVLVVSAGNVESQPHGGWFDGYPDYLLDPDWKIAEPGDAALVLTVGSVAARDVPGSSAWERLSAVAPAGAPSPFTRVGPAKGRTKEGMLKPELSADGGNLLFHEGTGQYIDNDPGVGVLTATNPTRSGRLLGVASGTSFAAPFVAREVARISERYPDAGGNLLRALTALSARQLSYRGMPETPDLSISAYGIPMADRVLESSGPRAILTVESVIDTNSTVVHEIPIPEEFARGRTQRTFRVALAYDPPVRRNRKEYIAGHMTVEFVRRLTFDAVERHYRKQPTRAEAAGSPGLERLGLPEGEQLRPHLVPGVSKVESNTLVRRDFSGGMWDPDDVNYFLVVTHNPSPWGIQRRHYDSQRYALAVELVDEEREDLDLHNLVRIRLRESARLRSRG